MNGARFVHDELVSHGWEVLVADAQKVKGLAPLACKTDKIDSRVLAVLSFRDLVPAIWLPTFELRREREISRWRLHLVKHRSTLKNRVHSTLITFGHQRHMSDLFGVSGRRLLKELEMPEPWRSHVDASLVLIDDLEARITQIAKDLRRSGADHPYVPILMTAPGFGWITSFTVACEIADISRFSSPVKLTGYTGLCPRVKQSGESDSRGPLSNSTGSATSAPSVVSANSAARKSRRSTSPASSPRRSGTCSLVNNPSLRQAPFIVWLPDSPFWNCATGASPNDT
jgi:transposase